MVERIDGRAKFECDRGDFLDVGAVAHLPPWTPQHVTVGDMQLALVSADGRVVAINDLCLCCGRPLSEGAFENRLLTCPACGWTYDVLRGCVHGLPNLKIETHEVRVENGRLLLPSAVTASSTLP